MQLRGRKVYPGGGSQKRGGDLAELLVCMFVAGMGSASVVQYMNQHVSSWPAAGESAACVFVARVIAGGKF